MPERGEPKPAFSKLRAILCWFRLPLIFFIALFLIIFLYLNWVGVPTFVREIVTTELRLRGIELNLTRLRLSGFKKFVAENVTIASERNPNVPETFIRRVEFHLDADFLRRMELRLAGLTLKGARLDWQMASTNSTPAKIAVEDVVTQLRFSDKDRIELASLKGRFLGLNFEASGSLDHASALRRKATSKNEPTHPVKAEDLERLFAELKNLQLDPSSVLRIEFQTDAANWDSLTAKAEIYSPVGTYSGGDFSGLALRLELEPSALSNHLSKVTVQGGLRSGNLNGVVVSETKITGSLIGFAAERHLSMAECRLESKSLENNRAKIENLIATVASNSSTNKPSTLNTLLTVTADRSSGGWGELRHPQLTMDLSHSVTNFSLAEGGWTVRLAAFESKNGKTENARLTGDFVYFPKDRRERRATADWSWWKFLEPFDLTWNVRLEKVQSPKLQMEAAVLSGRWQAPNVNIEDFWAMLYQGEIKSSARLDVNSRELTAKADFNFDAHGITPLLTTNAERWLAQFTWTVPPKVNGAARLILPAWTNQNPNWRKEVLPTVELSGGFEGGEGGFRGIPATAARSHFTLTNFFWRLPDMVLSRPEGDVIVDYQWDMRTQDYYWKLRSQVDPRILKPVLDPPQQRAFEFFNVETPPVIDGEIWGRWHDRDRIGFRASVAATNLSFRGERFDFLSCHLGYTNLLLDFRDVRVRRDRQEIFAPSGSFDPVRDVCFVTNAFSTMDPDLVTRVIGPVIRKAIAPYHFNKPPSVQVNGWIPTRRTEDADVHFNVIGEDFEYWKFKAPNVAGDVYWKGDTLQVTNVQAKFYGGWLRWAGAFDFTARKGADFNFRGSVGDVNLNTFMTDVTGKTNNMEGVLEGNLVISAANSDDWKSWQGFGDAKLRDGFLWNIPIFGSFSTMLNRVVPGLGSSRVHSGTATFMIDQSVIRTSDLELHSPAVRLQYVGSVDFDGNVDARVQAEILRDTWGVGKVVSLALWPVSKALEYKVNGTLNNPKSEPLYIPKILLWPFKPLQAMKQILPQEQSSPKPVEVPAADPGKTN